MGDNHTPGPWRLHEYAAYKDEQALAEAIPAARAAIEKARGGRNCLPEIQLMVKQEKE